MPKYKPIKINLSKEEDAEVYYQKTCGKNEAIRRHARILYDAGQGTESMKKLCENAECDYATARLLLKRYEQNGICAIYQCARGKKHSKLDAYEKEIIEAVDSHAVRTVPELILMLKEKFGLKVTETPVRNWLKKRGIIIGKPKQCQQKQMKKHRNIL